MDTIDRPDSNVPARYPGDSSRVPAPIFAPTRDLAVAPQSSTPQVTPRILIRGLSRHWWRIMLFWLVVSAPLIYLIYMMVEPTYEATSLLQADPMHVDIFNPGVLQSSRGDGKPYLLTQVQLITSDSVLNAALAKPGISNLPMIRSSKDPKADLRELLNVVIVGDQTYLIRVGLPSQNPDEAAKIVNAVVESYMDQHTSYHKNTNRALKVNMETELGKLEKKIQDVESRLLELVDKGKVSVNKHLTSNVPGKEADAAAATAPETSVTEAEYARAAGELFDMNIKLIDAETALDSAKASLDRSLEVADAQGDERKQMESEQLEARIREEFSRDPAVLPLIEQINETKETLENAKRMARQGSDPAVAAANRQARKLDAQWAALWERKHNEIAERLQTGGDDQRPEALTVKIKELEAAVDQLKQKKVRLAEMVSKLEIQNTTQNSEQLKASILNQELAYHKRLQEVVKLKLAQLDFDIGQEAYRIEVRDKAEVPKIASNNKRMKYMAVAPVGVLFALLGLFLLVEVKAERVGDPDALSTRVQSEVYALPPLPTVRSLRKRGPGDADDQIEQFIQRLDHLRFAVCGNPAELEKGRCVLITSAIGGEGKTTLAAQLAARCGNAGMSTLLIDADLRRTGLCSLLDVPEGPGLSDALTNDEPAATELVIPVQGGTFHLLPAGTPASDTSRVLQNRKLGLLIAQFRQIYDLVIIDCPPVLPVPDALILGRWVDGAVLAVRYDISRFPQVERARRQLDGAGIAVLGTVINGMKNSDSYYGRYSYSRRRSPQTDSPAAL
jgi:polysaccharide biosynthesis transport protein